MDNIQPFLGSDYKTALTAVEKITSSPPVGYKKPTSEVDSVHTVLIGQNNTIIALLEEVSRKLNHIIDSTKKPNLSEDINSLIKQVSKLSLGTHTPIKATFKNSQKFIKVVTKEDPKAASTNAASSTNNNESL